MKKLAVVFLILIMPALANAENNVQRETVEQLLEVMQAEKMVDSMYAQVDQMFLSMAKDIGIKEEEQPFFDQYMLKVAATMKKEMSWDKMKDPLIDIYIKHYSQKEIEDLLAFYSSDSGKSILNKMPAVMQDSMLFSQKMLKDFMPKIGAMAQELQQDLIAARKASMSAKPSSEDSANDRQDSHDK